MCLIYNSYYCCVYCSCIIQGRLDEEPSTIAFQPTYEQGSLLTIVRKNINIMFGIITITTH